MSTSHRQRIAQCASWHTFPVSGTLRTIDPSILRDLLDHTDCTMLQLRDRLMQGYWGYPEDYADVILLTFIKVNTLYYLWRETTEAQRAREYDTSLGTGHRWPVAPPMSLPLDPHPVTS